MGRRRIMFGVCWLLLALPALADDHWYRAEAFAAPRADRPATSPEDLLRAQALGEAFGARVDAATGRFSTLFPSGLLLDAESRRGTLDAAGSDRLGERAVAALRDWIAAHHVELRMDPAELGEARVAVHDADLVQVFVPRIVAGLPVRDSSFVATISHGRLSLAGTDNWADTPAPDAALPRVAAEAARDALAAREPTSRAGNEWKSPELAWTVVREQGRASLRLAWVIRSDLGEAGMRYEALVDARDGALLEVSDTSAYAATPRTIAGGVFPLSNDSAGDEGQEQPNWPMPFATVTTPNGPVTTDAGGRLPACVDGTISTTLSGPFVTVSETCGAINASSTGNIDLGISNGTNCTAPIGQSAGDTHAARTSFFHLNRMSAIARSRLPDNAFLRQPLAVVTNIGTQVCNAFWNGQSLQLFREGGGCGNTSENPSIFLHEWGHALDDNDVNGVVASPLEGIADGWSNWRTGESCIGRGFGLGSQCLGDAPSLACTACTGIRDSDFAKTTSAAPFTVTGNSNTCPVSGQRGPCNREVHCEGQLVSQALWDLWNRDLRTTPFNLDADTAREIAGRLMFLGSGPVTNWFQCTQGSGGCAATSGYPNLLAVDDDDGNIANGTPHMQAIFNAFNRHGIACASPVVTNAGCAGGPTAAPMVTTSALDGAVRLTWTPVANASTYQVLRTDGLRQCDQGKEIVATVSGTQFIDSGLRNGRPYSYVVLPVGNSASCVARASTCATATPVAGGAPDLDTARAQVTPTSGDADVFVDNCEGASFSLPFSNLGTSAAANVRITAVSSPSHPATQVLTPLPLVVSASLPSCGAATGLVLVKPQGLATGDTLRLAITWTSDALGGAPRTSFVDAAGTEQDLQAFASRTFDFEANAEGWATASGTFARATAGGGAGGSTAYLRSSAALDNACDVVVSPVVRLTATSTMSLSTSFMIEGQSAGEFFDRANIGIRPRGGARTLVTPTSGRLYTASGSNGTCGTAGQGGWAGTAATWAASSWTSAAMQSATFAGQAVQLEMRYGTDTSLALDGFRFDQVTVTNAEVAVPDAQSDSCGLPVAIFSNGFE